MPDPQEESIFIQALERDASHRGAFLDEACASDPELRARVERLLHHHEHGASFLSAPAVDAPEPRADADANVERPMPEGPGTAIGPYKLLEQIGEGGMGVVFLAEQTRPVRRQVALKVIKAGMDTRQVIARFEAERQALAVMDHPNIAKVLDAGATDSGRPYFVMELVKGVPITKYCDERRLPPRQRLELFVQVCEAVQHAHTKGIIHRDLKPSNVMVALYDGRPVPKVIDFGVAKATGGRLTDLTLFTGLGAVVGTPEYMSPEQAELNQLDVDTRSDVYSLGVILYELLTGSTPVERGRFKQAALMEALRVVREEEPTRPSTRLSTTDQLPSIAANRGLEPRKLSGMVRGELDWIVMKCLEKDRNRRYDTANGFAADVRRYLAGEAVQAVPPSATYRFRKFVRRNKGTVLAAAAVLLVLVGGIVATTWQAVRARDARRAEAQRADGERRAKQEAQQREAETRAVLGFVETRVFAAARPEGQEGGLGQDVTLRRAVEAALTFVDKSFKDQPLVEARLRMTLGRSFYYLGEARMAAEQDTKARALLAEHRGPDHPDTLASMTNLAGSYTLLGRHADACALHEETLALRKAKLGPDHRETLASMSNVASSYYWLGRYAEALPLNEEALALQQSKLGPDDPVTLKSMRNLANIYLKLGRHADALKLHQESVELTKAKHGPVHPETLGSMHELANSYHALGRHADALGLREETLALMKDKLGPRHPDTLVSINNLAASYIVGGRHADALKLLEETLPLMEATFGPGHSHTIAGMRNLALGLIKANRGAQAVGLIDECVRRAEGKTVDPKLVPGLIELRRNHFEKVKDASGCRTTSEMWERLNRTDAPSLYNAACYRSVNAALFKVDPKIPGADATRLAGEEADRAMAWLYKAVAAGFSDVAHIKNDATRAGSPASAPSTPTAPAGRRRTPARSSCTCPRRPCPNPTAW